MANAALGGLLAGLGRKLTIFMTSIAFSLILVAYILLVEVSR